MIEPALLSSMLLVGKQRPRVVLLDPRQRICPSGEQIVRDVYGPTAHEQHVEEEVAQLFEGAHWIVEPSRFVFAPPARAEGRSDAFPIMGTWVASPDSVVLRSECRANTSSEVSLDGVLHWQEEELRLDAIYSIGAGLSNLVIPWVAHVSQVLTMTGGFDHATRDCSAYDVEFTGACNGEPFEGPRGTLSIREIDRGGAVQIVLSCLAPGVGGVFASFRLNGNESEALMAGHSLVVERSASVSKETVAFLGCLPAPPVSTEIAAMLERTDRLIEDIAGRCDINTDRFTPYSPNLIAASFEADRVHLRLRIDGENALGQVEIDGTEPTVQSAGRYEARFGPAQSRTEVLREDDELSFLTIRAPVFDVTLSGSTEAGAFSGVAGRLIVGTNRSKEVWITLSSSGDIRLGWLGWHVEGLDSATVLNGEGLRVESNSARFSWYTTYQDEDGSEATARVESSQLRLKATIEPGQRVRGRIWAEGKRWDKSHAQSVLEARFEGVLRGGAVRRLKQALSHLDLSGCWETGDPHLGTFHLAQSKDHLTGNSSAQGALEGMVLDTRVDLRLTDGWMIARVLPSRQEMVGLWSTGGDRSSPRSWVARRQSELVKSGEPPIPDDLGDIRRLGRRLMDQGRFEQARQVLTPALALARSLFDAPGLDFSAQHDALCEQHEMLDVLAWCDLSDRDYESLLNRLQEALEVNRLLGPQAATLREVCHELRRARRDVVSACQQFDSYQCGRDSSIPSTALVDCQRRFGAIREALGSVVQHIGDTLEAVSVGTISPEQAIARAVAVLQVQVSAHEAAVEEILGKGLEAFSGKESLVQERARLLDMLRSYDGTFFEREPLATREDEMLAAVRSDPNLTPQDKELFCMQWVTSLLLVGQGGCLKSTACYLAELQIHEDIEARQKRFTASIGHMTTRLERWRATLVDDWAKIEALDLAEPFYASLVSTLLELDAPTEALLATEMARSRAFDDLLAGRSLIEPGISEVLAQSKAPSQATIPNLTAAPPLQLAELQHEVRKRGATLIEYFLLDDRLLIWVVSADGEVRAFTSSVSRTAISQRVKRLQDLLEEGTNGVGERAEIAELLRELHDVLVAPIPHEILPASADAPLILVPHRELFGVPFGALSDGQGVRLLERYSLVHAMSAAVLRHTGTEHPPADPNALALLALVNPSPMPDTKLPGLASTESNFGAISAAYAGVDSTLVLAGHEATRNALQRDASRAQVLYFATHAQANEESPIESYIALAKTQTSDGYLRVPTIFELQLRADLVILAACQTGRGMPTGDGVIGLSRAFVWAGARSLLMSLWTVMEPLSLQLMYDFHQYWRSGCTKAQALRRAQLDLMASYPDQPSAWASFILFGEGT